MSPEEIGVAGVVILGVLGLLLFVLPVAIFWFIGGFEIQKATGRITRALEGLQVEVELLRGVIAERLPEGAAIPFVRRHSERNRTNATASTPSKASTATKAPKA